MKEPEKPSKTNPTAPQESVKAPEQKPYHLSQSEIEALRRKAIIAMNFLMKE